MPNAEVRQVFGNFAASMLDINNYTYDLPAERIALHPLTRRDAAKLLHYQQGNISHRHFGELPDLLPANAALFFNDTKVIPARLHFRKESGAEIEIFLLSPEAPSSIVSLAMQARQRSVWRCTIGNLKRWPEHGVLRKNVAAFTLEVALVSRAEMIVEFTWSNEFTFAEVIQLSGETPLPPYLKREARDEDKERYQTVYSQYEGAVAAPTAGLHFTSEVFDRLRERNIAMNFLTLHVSAGTFQPVKSDNADEHLMHAEQLVVSRANVLQLLDGDKLVVPVGTTSLRTLESLYWYGVTLLEGNNAPFDIGQDAPYQLPQEIPARDALSAVLEEMDREGLNSIAGSTSIFIKPGYEFRICKGLVTNFHQPASTLILLVAAFVGDDWRRIYDEALQTGYRFLSYGDSSLLLPGK